MGQAAESGKEGTVKISCVMQAYSSQTLFRSRQFSITNTMAD